MLMCTYSPVVHHFCLVFLSTRLCQLNEQTHVVTIFTNVLLYCLHRHANAIVLKKTWNTFSKVNGFRLHQHLSCLFVLYCTYSNPFCVISFRHFIISASLIGFVCSISINLQKRLKAILKQKNNWEQTLHVHWTRT